MGHQAGQVDVSGGEHVELLQAGDGLGAHQGVGVVLHDGAGHQAGRPGGGQVALVACVQEFNQSRVSENAAFLNDRM